MGKLKYLSTEKLKAREVEKRIKRGEGVLIKTRTGQYRYLNPTEAIKREADNLRRKINRERQKANVDDVKNRWDILKSELKTYKSTGDRKGFENIQTKIDFNKKRIEREQRAVDRLAWERSDKIGKELFSDDRAKKIYLYTYNVIWTEGDRDIYEKLKQHVEEQTGQTGLNHLDVYNYFNDLIYEQYAQSFISDEKYVDSDGNEKYLYNLTSGYALFLSNLDIFYNQNMGMGLTANESYYKAK